MHVAAYIEQHPGSPQTIKQHLAAIKMLFDYLVIRHRLGIGGRTQELQTELLAAGIPVKFIFSLL
jgi:hypothetical protein